MAVYKSRFSQGRVGGSASSGVASLEIINQSTVECFVRRIICQLTAGTATSLGIGRPAAAGVTPTSPVALPSENGVDVTLVKTAIAWATPPTAPAQFFRIGGAPATLSALVEFNFSGQGLLLAPNQTLVVWNLAANATLNVTVEVEQNVVGVANS